MPLSFGRKNKTWLSRAAALLGDLDSNLPVAAGNRAVLNSKAPARLVDLRSPEIFRSGFIPGSYNVPDVACWITAQRGGLFNDREIYFLADDPDQLILCEEFGTIGAGSELAGWFGPDALEEWRSSAKTSGTIQIFHLEELAKLLSNDEIVVLDIVDSGKSILQPTPLDTMALQFGVDELPLCLDGLPAETPLCIRAANPALASFAASLIWNFGLHRVGYLQGSI